MKILSNNYFSVTQQYQNRQKTFLRPLSSPRYDTVCFKSRDFLDLPEQEIFNKISESMIPENFLGQGIDAEVYKIKDTNYCVRMPYWAQQTYNCSYSKELTPVDRINHVVAKLASGASIMRYFDGVTLKEYRHNPSERFHLQEEISEMPVKSYSKLLHQIANAIDNEMLFDFSPGNLIVDTINQQLTAIDFFGISDNPRPIRPMYEMYSVLTCFGSVKEISREIYEKVINAGLEEFKPNKIPCMDTDLFDFLEVSLKRMGDVYTPNGEKIKSDIMYKSSQLKKIKKAEIIDKATSEQLQKCISDLKSVIKKVH